ncbi:UNVERIFIED_CONTAM: hypothetical protein HDU68_001959 [Siphonaria sp. JEL0065]|nr:hypothetical protein HDU68_001959 [Siphonaria sp. JEL0065]
MESTDNNENTASATTPAYYLDAKFDPHRATIAELKTILSKHGVALPTGRVLKEEYVQQFRELASSLSLSSGSSSNANATESRRVLAELQTPPLLLSQIEVAAAAEPSFAESTKQEFSAHNNVEVRPNVEVKDEEEEEESSVIAEPNKPVGELVAHFDATPPSDDQLSQIESMTTAIANAVNDRKKRLVEFGKGIRSSFGFARRTIFDPVPIPIQRPEKLRRSGPPPLPPPPNNPQLHLRTLQKDAHRPDFVVPVMPPTYISQTGLSPPPSLVERKTRRSKNGSTPSPTSLRASNNHHSTNKTSPLGLRSTGPRRVATGTTPLREQVIVTRTPPFKPHDRSIVSEKSKVRIDLSSLMQEGGEDDDEEHGENEAVRENSVSNQNGSSSTTTNTVVDAEFKRKYNLEDFDETDESESEISRKQVSPKRRKSLAVGEEGIDVDESELPFLTPRQFYLSVDGNRMHPSSPGNYNLRARGTPTTVASASFSSLSASKSATTMATVSTTSVVGAVTSTSTTTSSAFPLLSMALKSKEKEVQTLDKDTKQQQQQQQEPEIVKTVESINQTVSGGETEEDEEQQLDNDEDVDEEIEIIFKPHAVRKVARVFGSIFAVAMLLPFLFALGSWYLEVGNKIEYCKAGQNQMWIPPKKGSIHGIAKDYWGQVFPSCVVCPEGGVCEEQAVVACLDREEMGVFGEEGLSPLSGYIGLGPMCLSFREMGVGAEDITAESHVNPRIHGRPLPFSKRLEFWAASTNKRLDVANSALVSTYEYVVSGKAGDSVMEIVMAIRAGFLKIADDSFKRMGEWEVVKFEYFEGKVGEWRQFMAVVARGVSKALALFALLHPFSLFFESWTPPNDKCGDVLRIDGLIPFSDRFLCVFEQAKLELEGSSVSSGSSIGAADLTMFSSLGLPLVALIAMEGTRRIHSFKSVFMSFPVVVGLSLLISPAVVFPLVWLSPFFLTSATSSLGPVNQIARIGVGMCLLTTTSLLLEYTNPQEYVHVKMVLTQYLPPLLPMLWISFSRTTPTTTKFSARVATTIYILLGIFSFIQYTIRFLIPLAIQNNPLETIPPLVFGLVDPKQASLQCFVRWEHVILGVAGMLFIAHEVLRLGHGGWDSFLAVLFYVGRGTVVGPGASLVVFLVWREQVVARSVGLKQLEETRNVDLLRGKVAKVGIAKSFSGTLLEQVQHKTGDGSVARMDVGVKHAVVEEKERREDNYDGNVADLEDSPVMVSSVVANSKTAPTASTQTGTNSTNSSKRNKKNKKKNKNKPHKFGASTASDSPIDSAVDSDFGITDQPIVANKAPSAATTPAITTPVTTNSKLETVPHNAAKITTGQTSNKETNKLIELIFHKTSFAKRTLFWISSILFISFAVSIAIWYYEVGSQIEYCQVGSTSWKLQTGFNAVFPVCISCPEGAVCIGDRVEGCLEDGFSVYGDEGLGPLSSYIALEPVCLPNNFEPNQVNTHFNTRIQGKTLSLASRFKLKLWTPEVRQQLAELRFLAMKVYFNVYHRVLQAAITVQEHVVVFSDWVSWQIDSVAGLRELVEDGKTNARGAVLHVTGRVSEVYGRLVVG